MPVSRTTNLKFIMEFVNHFMADGGKVTFLHVTESSGVPVSPAEWRKALSAISTSHLLSTSGPVQVGYGVRNAKSVVDGVLGEVGQESYDLILFANSTYRKHLNHLFGNKMDEITRRSPVETVVLSYRDDMPLKYGKILVPTSGYRHAHRAARMAGEIARRHGSEVTVLFVGKPGDDPRPIVGPVADELKAAGVKARTMFKEGTPVDAIIEEAGRGYDLMMIGAHEHPAHYSFILGSIADRLIKKAPCPVLMVKTVGSP